MAKRKKNAAVVALGRLGGRRCWMKSVDRVRATD
jgi:hypothetical protein